MVLFTLLSKTLSTQAMLYADDLDEVVRSTVITEWIKGSEGPPGNISLSSVLMSVMIFSGRVIARSDS